ncbi:MAG: hypothetical protein JJU45_15065 [Acidimicrobiia bacterium]|nr:hypothetical protein [Acidimicrobiia bacterium]
MMVGPAVIVAAALVVAGVFKLRDPEPTRAMLRTLRLPSSTLVVAGIGAVEITAGVVAVVMGGLTWLAVAVAYALFSALMVVLVRKGDAAASCGCFGSLSSPPTAWHVGADVSGAFVAGAAAVTSAPSLLDAAAGSTVGALTLGALIVVGTWLFVVAMTVLPATMATTRRDRSSTTAAPSFALVAPPRRIERPTPAASS